MLMATTKARRILFVIRRSLLLPNERRLRRVKGPHVRQFRLSGEILLLLSIEGGVRQIDRADQLVDRLTRLRLDLRILIDRALDVGSGADLSRRPAESRRPLARRGLSARHRSGDGGRGVYGSRVSKICRGAR